MYREVITELKAAGATWIQLDEPVLVMDLEGHKLQAFTGAYAELESTLSGLNVLVETYLLELVFDKVVWINFPMGFFDGDVCRKDRNLGTM